MLKKFSIFFCFFCFLASPIVWARQIVDLMVVDAVIFDSRGVQSGDTLVVHDHKIVAVGSQQEIRSKYSSKNTINAKGGYLTPGFVNTHTHVSNIVLRGLSEGRSLSDWWSNKIWPIEKKYLEKDFVFSLAVLGVADQLRSGVTTLNDMSFFASSVAKACEQMGVRAFVGETLISQPAPSYSSIKEALNLTSELLEFKKARTRLNVTVAPHGLHNLSPKDFELAVDFAKKNNLPIHMHFAESDIDARILKEKAGRPLVDYLSSKIGTARLIYAHGLRLNEKEIKNLKGINGGLSVNLSSNQLLTGGEPNLDSYSQKGIQISIGSDGAISNPASDFFEEMRGILKMYSKQQKIGELDIYRYSTVGGASVLGISDQVGLIRPGYVADFVILKLPADRMLNLLEPINTVVKVARSSDVHYLVIDGETVIFEGSFTPKINELIERSNEVVRKKLGTIKIDWEHLRKGADERK